MRATARRNLEAAAARSGAWLGTTDVLRRQAGHRAEPHVIAAAGNLVTHLAATGENTPGGSGMLMTPARQQISQPGAGVTVAIADPGAQLAEVAMPGQEISEPPGGNPACHWLLPKPDGR